MTINFNAMNCFYKIIYSGLVLSMLTGCHHEDSSDGGSSDEGNAYMTLAIQMPQSGLSGKAINGGTGSSSGTSAEQKITDVLIYVWDDAGKVVAKKYAFSDLAQVPGHEGSYTTPAFAVKGGESKVVAIVNGGNLFTETSIGGQGAGVEIANLRKEITLDAASVDAVSVEGKFLMTNAFDIRSQNVDGQDLTVYDVENDVDRNGKNPYHFHLDGTVGVFVQGTKQHPTTVVVPVERAVAKVDEVSTELVKTVEKTGDQVTFTEVALVNGNKKFFPIKKVRANGNNDYIVDPNFDNNAQEMVDANFYSSKPAEFIWKKLNVNDSPTNEDVFYTLENTMLANQQHNAYTTGLYYKAVYRLKKHINEEPAPHVYRYMGRLYDWEDLQKANGYPGGLTESSTVDDFAAKGIVKYENGVCYYPYWIYHVRNDENVLAPMEFAVVRNNWYQMTIGKVSGIGTDKPIIPDPEIPDETTDAQLEVIVKVLPWIVRSNTVDF